MKTEHRLPGDSRIIRLNTILYFFILEGFKLVMFSAVLHVALVIYISVSDERGAKFTAPPPTFQD
jgi:hypothetical protein